MNQLQAVALTKARVAKRSLTCSITSISPGPEEGGMLHPVTRKRSVPDERKTSPASSHFRAFTSPKIDADEIMIPWALSCKSEKCR
jgi:hypothetical protein